MDAEEQRSILLRRQVATSRRLTLKNTPRSRRDEMAFALDVTSTRVPPSDAPIRAALRPRTGTGGTDSLVDLDTAWGTGPETIGPETILRELLGGASAAASGRLGQHGSSAAGWQRAGNRVMMLGMLRGAQPSRPMSRPTTRLRTARGEAVRRGSGSPAAGFGSSLKHLSGRVVGLLTRSMHDMDDTHGDMARTRAAKAVEKFHETVRAQRSLEKVETDIREARKRMEELTGYMPPVLAKLTDGYSMRCCVCPPPAPRSACVAPATCNLCVRVCSWPRRRVL